MTDDCDCRFFRLFSVLRAVFIGCRGTNAKMLENIKRTALDLLSFTIANDSAQDDEAVKGAQLAAKHQLQEDIAALRRIKRVPLTRTDAQVDMKKLLQTGEEV